METTTKAHLELQKKIAEDVEKFLANGGTITEVPIGETAITEPMWGGVPSKKKKAPRQDEDSYDMDDEEEEDDEDF